MGSRGVRTKEGNKYWVSDVTFIHLTLIIAFLPFSVPSCQLFRYLVLYTVLRKQSLVRILPERVNMELWRVLGNLQPGLRELLRRLI